MTDLASDDVTVPQAPRTQQTGVRSELEEQLQLLSEIQANPVLTPRRRPSALLIGIAVGMLLLAAAVTVALTTYL